MKAPGRVSWRMWGLKKVLWCDGVELMKERGTRAFPAHGEARICIR